MKKAVTRGIRYLLFLFVMFVTTTCNRTMLQVNAAGHSYDNSEKRIAYNEDMHQEMKSETNSKLLARYQDKSLKDMYETKEKGMTISQQKWIKEFADKLVEEAAVQKGETLTDYEKLRVFHDWIVEHFYYYRNVDEISENCDNPYYLLTTEYERVENDGVGKIRSRCNGFSATFIALARSQNIIARDVGGYYNTATRMTADDSLWPELGTLEITHHWSQAYVDRDGDGKKEWIYVDCNADCWNRYDKTSHFVNQGNFYDPEVYKAVRCAYFDVSVERLSQSHLIVEYRAGSKDLKYITDSFEKKKLKTFLNIKSNKKTNGKRINSSYKTSDIVTWFSKKDTQSKGDGNGKLYKLYWPEKKSLYGKLDLSEFTALQNVKVINNKLTSLYVKKCPSLLTVSAYGNNLKTIDTRGSGNIKLLSVQSNPATYVAYSFNKNKTAIIKTSAKGGTVSVKYSKSTSGKHTHTMTAVCKKGYKFSGWYSGSKCISKNKRLVKNNKSSFTYVAKFKKK